MTDFILTWLRIILDLLFAIIRIVIPALLIYIMFRGLRLFDRYMSHLENSYGQKSKTNTEFESPTPTVKKKPRSDKYELSPETIAPAIKKPPRPAGGFGSVVNHRDDNTTSETPGNSDN